MWRQDLAILSPEGPETTHANYGQVIDDNGMMLLLPPGESTLMVPLADARPHCGLIPLGCPCESISTTGLQP